MSALLLDGGTRASRGSRLSCGRKLGSASRRRGFTLLEVMVAVAILGLALTAILSAQAGAFAASSHARHLSIATGLARCKMSELEEHLLRDGYQELDEADNGPCCEGDETPNVRCSWKIEKPQLPEAKLGELDLDTELKGGELGPLGALQGEGDQLFTPDGGTSGAASALSQVGALGGPEAAGMASMLMGMVYPQLKSIFEASTRRVTVTISWTEGSKEHSFDVAEWVTNPQQTPLDQETGAEDEDTGTNPAPGSTGKGTNKKGAPPSMGGPFAPKTGRTK